MSILNHGTDRVNPTPCPCPDCTADRNARDLAAHLGLADAARYDVSGVDLSAFGEPGPDDDAAAADAVRWALFSPDLPRTYRDEDNPDRWAREWEPPTEDDEAARFELSPWATEGGCGPDELSPEEQEIELYGEAEWVRACREHARWLEEREQEAAYHERIGRLTTGGHPSDW